MMSSVVNLTPGRGAGGRGRIDVTPAKEDIRNMSRSFVKKAARILMREFTHRMPVDTGFARNKLTMQPAPDGVSMQVGILDMSGIDDKDARNYPLYQNYGTRPHWVSFFNKDGTERETLINWAVRHGFDVRQTPTGRPSKHPTFKMRRIWITGKAQPWYDGGVEAAVPRIAEELRKTRLRDK